VPLHQAAWSPEFTTNSRQMVAEMDVVAGLLTDATA
jgi:hypothetical protein